MADGTSEHEADNQRSDRVDLPTGSEDLPPARRDPDVFRGLERYLVSGIAPGDISTGNVTGGLPTGAGDGPGAPLAVARRALEPVQASLTAAGFYAYGTLDDANRWTIAVDDEAGRIDIRVGADGFEVELWASSPGLYAEEEHPFRRRALERLARITIPNIARGLLEPHQTATWDEIDQGVAVGLRYELPFTQCDTIGAFVRERLPELEELLGFVESRVAS